MKLIELKWSEKLCEKHFRKYVSATEEPNMTVFREAQRIERLARNRVQVCEGYTIKLK